MHLPIASRSLLSLARLPPSKKPLEGEEDAEETWHTEAMTSASIMDCINCADEGDESLVIHCIKSLS